MKTDTVIKNDVEAELHWEPQVDDTDISVKITNGVVTLIRLCYKTRLPRTSVRAQQGQHGRLRAITRAS